MKTVNLGEKYTTTVLIRLTDSQKEFLSELSSMLGVTTSEYVRMLITSNIAAYRRSIEDESKNSNSNDKL